VTDGEWRAIGNRWDALKGGYKRLSFEEAHKDMRQVLGELWRTREALSQAAVREMRYEMALREAGLLVLTLEGWQTSDGIKGELAAARQLALPVAEIEVGSDPPAGFVAAAYAKTDPELCAPPCNF
jgi:hypothetical protein